jgi:D-alanine-D-alanine ligase
MKITVLYGGPSTEREVSLVSGRAVIEGLRAAGHEVFGSDISPDDLSALSRPCDVVFPVLHGEFGEDGKLQEILEKRGIAFVGSGSRASRLGMDKIQTKRAWEKHGLPTPGYVVLERNRFDAGQLPLRAPAVAKVFDGGSSIGVFICKTDDALRRAIEKIFAEHDRALIERYVAGPELTIGLLEERPLPPIRIIPASEFFDYEAKYHSPQTQHRFDTGLQDALVCECQELARRANDIVGARDLARVDIMIDQATNKPYLLEINTMPGFTPVSLLPEAAAKTGISFSQLVDRLARRAHARREASAAA